MDIGALTSWRVSEHIRGTETGRDTREWMDEGQAQKVALASDSGSAPVVAVNRREGYHYCFRFRLEVESKRAPLRQSFTVYRDVSGI